VGVMGTSSKTPQEVEGQVNLHAERLIITLHHCTIHVTEAEAH